MREMCVTSRGLVEDEPLLVHMSQTHGYPAYYIDLKKCIGAARMAELQGVLKRRYGVEGPLNLSDTLPPPQLTSRRENVGMAWKVHLHPPSSPLQSISAGRQSHITMSISSCQWPVLLSMLRRDLPRTNPPPPPPFPPIKPGPHPG